ncbi:MAG: DNA mismatch repair protein MutS [Candidatus Xenobia bacterium]
MTDDALMHTPMLRQYAEMKAQHPGCLLLMRCGDFYEAYGEDAKTAGAALDIVVTSKESGNGQRVAMAGFPHFSVDGFMRSLIRQGFRVALADQMEDPKQAKGLVKREVTRVVSSGTVLDPTLLDEKRNNYIAALTRVGDVMGLAVADVSTGELVCTELQAERAVEEVARWQPAELLLAHSQPEVESALERENGVVTRLPAVPSVAEAIREVCAFYGLVALEGLGIHSAAATVATWTLMRYVQSMQKTASVSLSPPRPYSTASCLLIDPTTARNLELTETFIGRERKGSLLWAMDETQTAMGARLLKQWVERPLVDLDELERRHDAVEELVRGVERTDALRARLKTLVDIPRLVSRVVYGTANGRDLIALAASLSNITPLREEASSLAAPLLAETVAGLDPLDDLRALIMQAVNPECPATLRDGNVIKDGFHPELDELRGIRKGARGLIAEMEERERARSGIKSLKIGYNQVFGYYIEVTKANLAQVPPDYVRKQTLAGAERFICEDLKEVESRYLGAQERIVALEAELFAQVRDQVAAAAPRIRATAAALAHLDVLAGLAALAVRYHYCRPEMHHDVVLDVQGGRHPVVERMLDGCFVPNDLYLDGDGERLIVLTGPNMAGKSTWLRQAALLTAMAQMGSFVPAERARIGLADRIFTRVGASDDLRMGRSTFLVEMAEVANILNNATPRSLVILDEVGRGTSTHDGLSLACAIAEHIHHNIGARTLFATHYHELTQLGRTLPGVRNYRVAVRENGQEITFLYRIVPGASDRSYGIHVARLAGIPAEVLTRAEALLSEFEGEPKGPRRIIAGRPLATVAQMQLFERR